MRILYLDLDALNPSHLGCYGYHRNTSPTIDEIASQGVRFDNMYCSDAPCLPSRTAFYQGRFGIHTGVVGHGGTTADPKPQGAIRDFRSTYEEDSFPRQLQKLGFHTAMISPFGQRHAAHHFYAGFHEMHNTGQGGAEPAEVVQPVVEKWLRQNAARDNWYLHINFWDIHTNYRVPAGYGEPFADEPIAEWFTDELIEEQLLRAGPHSALDLGMYEDADPNEFPRVPKRITDRASLTHWINGYDTAIRYVDDHIARILALLREAGVEDEVAIIISADHGENQGDLGIYGEHGTADQATCRIPFVVRWPGVQGGAASEALCYHLDWAPTCLALLGDEARALTPEVWDGASFADCLRGRSAEHRQELVLSQCAHVAQRSVRFDQDGHRWLYIRTYHDGFHLFPEHMLFDLATDPHELNDLADAYPEVLREATWRMMAWHDRAMAKVVREHPSDVTDPLYKTLAEGGPLHARADHPVGRPGDLRVYLRRLEQTGRGDAAALLRQKYLAD